MTRHLFRPDEAHKLAFAAWRSHSLRRSERDLLEYMLRQTRPDGSISFSGHRGTKALSNDLGLSRSSVIRARARLVDVGLVCITQRGLGRTVTSYRMAVEHLQPAGRQGVLWPRVVDTAVHPGENALPSPPDRCQDDTSEVAARHPRGVTVTPPNARARFLSSKTSLSNSPLPAASRRGAESQATTKCPTARRRGEACANCRLCGTTKRLLAKAEARAAEPPWCGKCESPTKWLRSVEIPGEEPVVIRCPDCNPLAAQVEREHAAVAGDPTDPNAWVEHHEQEAAAASAATSHRGKEATA